MFSTLGGAVDEATVHSCTLNLSYVIHAFILPETYICTFYLNFSLCEQLHCINAYAGLFTD